METAEETLARIDQKVNEAIQALSEGKDTYHLDLEELRLRIRLSGPSWAGVIDKPVAKFLIDLDAMLADEFREQGIALPDTKHGLVALQVKDGSWDAILKYSKDTATAFSSMTPGQQILVVVTVLAAVGIYKAADIIKALQAVKLKKADGEQEAARARERIELVEAVGKVASDQARLQAPIRNLVNKMSNEDKIELPAQIKPLSKQEVKEGLAPRTRSKPTSYYVDHPYKVDDLLTKNPENWQIGLSYGDVSFRAALAITDDEIQKLFKDFQEAHAAGSVIAPDMNVTAKINERGISSAIVVGLDLPRKNAISLSDALQQARESNDAPVEGDDEELD